MEKNYPEPHNGMEMPTPCIHCGNWFDLLDGCGSEKWHPNTTICEACYDDEAAEIEREVEIKDLLDSLSDAEYTIKDCKEQLSKLGYKFPEAN